MLHVNHKCSKLPGDWKSDKCQAIPDRFSCISARENVSASQIFSAKTTIKTEIKMHSYQDDSYLDPKTDFLWIKKYFWEIKGPNTCSTVLI